MPELNDSQLEGRYAMLLEKLDGEKRAHLVKNMAESDAALKRMSEEQADAMDDLEQDLQAAVADYEEAQHALSEVEDAGGEPDAALLEKLRRAQDDASKVMEACMNLRTERAASFAHAKEAAKKQRSAALRASVEQFTNALDNEEDDKSPKSVTGETTSFEPLQDEHVDLVIRIGRFDKVGIVAKPDGVIQTAPGGLFNSDYQVIGIDGKRFVPGLENADGTHTIILRCRNSEMLASLRRVPPKLLRGKALKLMQLKISPGDKGFGIDLSEVNHVAGLVKGGKAEEADLRSGDIIVAADGVGIGNKRLVDVLRKGRPSYVFNVVRPAMAMPTDRADELVDPAGSASATTTSSKPSSSPAMSAEPAANAAVSPKSLPSKETESGEDDLKRSLAESLGRMQQSAEMLAGPAVRIVRCTPKEGTGITVEWTPRPGGPKVSHYHLQWKLVNDREWTHTEASKKVAATVVTKGNLKSDGLYQFRVRACSKESAEWGAWCPASPPLAPTSEPEDEGAALSTIAEESSEVAASAANSEVVRKSPEAAASKAQVWSDLPPPPDASPGQALAMDVVQGLLKDQRQALETQSAQELASAKAEAEAVREELEDWKAKFIEAAGNSMQKVVEEKEATRAEVLAELEGERCAVEAMKAEASKAIELIRAAEKARDDALAEAAHYKKRFDVAKAEAKAETDREADMKVNVVMRNAALELRDKVKFVEQQTDATVKRAVDEAVRLTEAKALTTLRNEKAVLEAAHEKQLQSMRDMVGAGAKNRISEIQAAQDERVSGAVRQALAEARNEAARNEAAAVKVAVAEGVEDVEARMAARQSVLEQQLVGVRKEYEARMSEMYSEEQVQSLLLRAKDESRSQHDKALREVAERAEEKAAHERQKALETVSETIRKSVRDREAELLANSGKELQVLAEKELQDAGKLVKHAGAKAAAQWDTGNDDFEEQVLKKTQPVVASYTPAVEAPSPKKPAAKGKLSAAELMEHDDLIENYGAIAPPRDNKGVDEHDGDEDGGESMVAPPKEYLRMKARHRAEEKSMLARQSIDQYREEEAAEDAEEGRSEVARKEGRARRAAEKEELKQRQFAEALSAGQKLAFEDRAFKAREDELDVGDFRSPAEDDIRSRTAQHPELRKAYDKVNELEKKLHSMQDGAAAAINRGDNMIARDNVQSILQRGSDKAITDDERENLQDVMNLLQRHMLRDKTMQKMLLDIEPRDAVDHETASCVQQDITRDEDQMGALALQLEELITRDTSAKLDDDELALLRQLTSELKTQQEQAEMREAQITWLQAEAKRVRLNAVLDARAELDKLHLEAVEAEKLALPTTPIAAAEDAFSIAVDWLPPVSELAVKYHLQWRSSDDNAWTSSSASESLSVACCTKGHLRSQLTYQFRVRAADRDGKWGPWSAPTEPTSPNVLLSSLPSRPQLRTLGKGRIEARWSPPEGAPAVGYELQWRTCDGQWGEASSSMESEGVIASTPSLVFGTYYTFRVRASIQRHRGLHWTDWSPPSAPVMPTASKVAKGEGKVAKPKGKKDAPPKPPSRTEEEATESVIEADVRGVLSGYHPTAQAAVEAKLQKVMEQRAKDDANVQTLEQRNRAIANKAREDQLNELIKVKRAALSRAVANGEALPLNKDEPATASWD